MSLFHNNQITLSALLLQYFYFSFKSFRLHIFPWSFTFFLADDQLFPKLSNRYSSEVMSSYYPVGTLGFCVSGFLAVVGRLNFENPPFIIFFNLIVYNIQ